MIRKRERRERADGLANAFAEGNIFGFDESRFAAIPTGVSSRTFGRLGKTRSRRGVDGEKSTVDSAFGAVSWARRDDAERRTHRTSEPPKRFRRRLGERDEESRAELAPSRVLV